MRVIEPIVAGMSPDTDMSFDHAVSYVHDLGLIRDTRALDIANPIYREVLLRVLGDRNARPWSSRSGDRASATRPPRASRSSTATSAASPSAPACW
ncbi:hypothetical protein GCM10009733_099320 [Nonomuraea maheshkhaliensis]|uniref:Uncharacterized protein n=1 Tax=Nonomuraea maheshkhaliensis TaxID=419590 RepID=A0ABP4TEQ4_9ACTN